MNFSKSTYCQQKVIISGLIKKTHDWNNTEGFISDGIINPEIYSRQKLKILVILAESYGYNEDGETNIEDQLGKDILGLGNPKVQTIRKLASLFWLIHKSFASGNLISIKDFVDNEFFKTTQRNYCELQEALLRVAWINVKKASNPQTKMDEGKVYSDALKNKEILSRQINSISPDLVIVCSNVVINSIYDSGILGMNYTKEKYVIQTNNSGLKVLNVNHPACYSDWSYSGLYEIAEIVYSSLILPL